MKRLDACVEDIRQWMENNFLKLNDSKTELIIFGTPNNVGKVAECTVLVGDAIILPSGSVGERERERERERLYIEGASSRCLKAAPTVHRRR